METNIILDSILGTLALLILFGGLFMLFGGIRKMGNKS